MVSLRTKRRTRSPFRIWLTNVFIFLTAASMACSLPSLLQRKPTPENNLSSAVPTPLPEPLPPALLESSPPPGSELALDTMIQLTFNQPMNRTSVEAAVDLGGIAGRFDWANDSVMTFIPDAPLMPDSEIKMKVSVTAQSSKGMPLNKPVELQYRTAGLLQLTQILPADGQNEIDPESAVVASFNLPVVPLGADPSSLPAAFGLNPTAAGRGEWINTSTYIFYPDPGLAGGLTYTASLNPDLKSTAGTPLSENVSWSFNVSTPRVTGFLVQEGIGVYLDTTIEVTFNQRMDAESVENAFILQSEGKTQVNGISSWDNNFTTLVFTPTILLDRSTTYQFNLAPSAVSAAQIPLSDPFQTSWITVGDFALIESKPGINGVKETWESLQLTFSTPLIEKDLEKFFRFEPRVENIYTYFDPSESILYLNGDFLPNTSYILNIDPNLKDRWGGSYSSETSLPFRTAPLRPRLEAPNIPSVMFMTPQDSGISVQLTNLNNLPMTLDTITPTDLITLTGPNGYELRKNIRSEDRKTWQKTFTIPSDKTTPVQLPVTPNGNGLNPGIYILRVELDRQLTYANDFVLVVSNVHLIYKISSEDVLVWAVDVRNNKPVADAPLAVFNETGELLVSGQTDKDGIFRTALPESISPFESSTVLLGQPGEELFAAAISGWNLGIEPYNFDISSDYQGPGLTTYFYTDRPIYRPGQTVYFKAIPRFKSNGRYSLPNDLTTLPLTLFDGEGGELANFDLPLSAFGSVHGEYTLDPDAKPGYYNIQTGEQSIYFQVAEYRKPEINLQVNFDKPQVLAGESLTASVNARYFFDAPAGNVTLEWVLYESGSSFYIPDYQTGPLDDRWMQGIYFDNFYGDLGKPIGQGKAQTGPDGLFTLDIENPAVSETFGRSPRQFILEVTAIDESGQPVSARGSIQIHPADFYIGIRPDIWAGQAGEESGYDIFVADWLNNSAGSRSLSAIFSKVVYIRQDPPADRPYESPTYVREYTEIASTDLATSPDGKARLAFTAPQPGTYQLEVRGEASLTQVLLWFGGAGQTVWPNLPNQRLKLTPNLDSYKPGDTALVFIPNPFPGTAEALITVERGVIMRHEIRRLAPGGTSIAIPLTEEDAPNVYIAVSLLGKNEQNQLDFRQGYAELSISPDKQTLNVNLTRIPERTGPGGEVEFTLKVTDSGGTPVQGEFSLAVIDLAALALADPNSSDILPAFYGSQPLGVRTNLALAAYANRSSFFLGGIGGGGGGEAAPNVVREDFPDTAYWNGEVLTDANGEAKILVNLPDNLTTWQVDVRGVTDSTLVGQARTEVIATKDVLIRPVTPRFLVAGDHTELAAVVQNNTQNDLTAQVNLQTGGFVLDGDQPAQVQVMIPAGGRAKVTWWGTAQDSPNADLLFSVQAGEFQDASRPSLGALPILHYTTRQAYATSGILEGAVQQLELVSIPPNALVSDLYGEAGKLNIALSPSLAAAMLPALDALEYYPYQSTEQILARFLPNLLLHQALQSFNITTPDLANRLERTLQPGLQKLAARQNLDGGWGWWSRGESDPFITAYVLFGLTQSLDAGIDVSPKVIQSAINYLVANQAVPDQIESPYLLDRAVFELFALSEAEFLDQTRAQLLYEERNQLSPWAKALLALTLEANTTNSTEAADLLAVLQAEAQRSSTGAFWMDSSPRWQNLSNTVSTTSIVLYALAKREPASPLLPDALRFIMASRGAQGYWLSTFETSWALLAATAYMQGTGELSGDFSFQATINNSPVATGQAGGDTWLTPVQASIPVTQLYPVDPNALRVQRSGGSGRLYYTALLDIAFPADLAAPLNRGFTVERSYHLPSNCNKSNCPAVTSGSPGDQISVQLTLVVPKDAYHVLVEDFIPAGSEILDRSLKTSQLGSPEYPELDSENLYSPSDPFGTGWGWWLFNNPDVFDDHIAWTANYLPAGTYQLTYTLTLLQPGEYRLMPARATQLYFPDVQGNSAGAVFRIEP